MLFTPFKVRGIELNNQVVMPPIVANYDPRSLAEGPYPPFLKARIASETGHLSNRQAAEALAAAANGKAREVWLAHLSATNNSPRLAEEAVVAHLRERGVTSVTLGITLRERPSLEWEGPHRWQQRALL